jgi:hypothetical protein
LTKAGRFDKLCGMANKKKKPAPKPIKKEGRLKKWLLWGFLFVVGSVLITENAPVFIVSTIFGWQLHKHYKISKNA